MDEKRIQARRKDLLICCKVSEDNNEDNLHAETLGSENAEAKNPIDGANAEDEHLHRSGRIMDWFAGLILIPWVKALILVVFTTFLGTCIWSTTLLRLNFDFRSILPSDSYIIRFYDSANLYTNRQGPAPFVYFRYVDQSDPDIQTQMLSYVDDLVGIDAITEPPFRFWLVDYLEYVGDSNSSDLMQDLPFIDGLYLFLQDSDHDFWEDLIFDETGRQLVASRTQVNMDNVNVNVLATGLHALEQQREVSRAQLVNQGTDDWAFFTFDEIYLLYEFLFITPTELTKSTLIGLGSVSLMSVLFMPHWSGILFVAPMVMILYVDLMGFIQFFGIDVNGVTYVSLLVAIGLLVDYVMHVVLRFYETPKTSSRDAKVRDVLRTMGASVMLGGVSTFLGVVPLMFSASDIIFTFVITFGGVVIIGKYNLLVAH